MAEISWAAAINGDFTDAADWTGGVVPGAADDAILGAAGGDYIVTLSSSDPSQTVNSIQTAANATLVLDDTFSAMNGTGSGANAGDIVRRRYHVLAIDAKSITVEDMLDNNKQKLPLSAN